LSTRERILDAAERILRTRGVVQATTKEIAQETGVSEPTLYKYFGDKERLLLAVLQERVPGLSRVSVHPGEGDVAENLTELAHAALEFYQRSYPMLGARNAAGHDANDHLCFTWPGTDSWFSPGAAVPPALPENLPSCSACDLGSSCGTAIVVSRRAPLCRAGRRGRWPRRRAPDG
jgi:hypothetical protein